MKEGVPYQVASDWNDDERLASLIVLGELDGGVWDWRRMAWKKAPYPRGFCAMMSGR